MTASFQPSPEHEATLLITSEQPDQLLKELSDLRSIGGYELIPGESIAFQDTYFDTPARDLSARDWALRVRTSGQAQWLALKGPSRTTEWGGLERSETEAYWSSDCLDSILRDLIAHGVNVVVGQKLAPDLQPLEAMRSAGFTIIQKRETRRAVRIVIELGEIVAELCLDRVLFTFGKGSIRHSEVEIEARSPSYGQHVKILADHLFERYRPYVRHWDHSKLATGFALERLLQTGALDVPPGEVACLVPEMYDKVADLLTRRSEPA